jgi:hypothetical protein
MARCHAVRLHLKDWRCRNQAGDSWFCHQHRSWPLITLSTLCAVIGSFCLGLLQEFIGSYISPPSPEERKTLQVTQETPRDVATVQNEVAAIRRLLGNDTSKPSLQLNAFIESRHLEEKSPLGFVLLYSDGRKTLHYGRPTDKVQFDPSEVQLTRYTATRACVSIRVSGNTINNGCIQRNVKGGWKFMTFNDIAFWSETLANSDGGVAWVLGFSYK